jgi:hypothetical protein
VITKENAQRIVNGEIDWMADSEQSLIKELYLEMRYQGMGPKTIVDYTREPFIYGPGNVRVTFDYDIRTGLRSTDFLNPDCVTIPAADAGIMAAIGISIMTASISANSFFFMVLFSFLFFIS